MSALDVAQVLWLLVAAIGLALSVSYAGLPVLGAGAFLAVGGFGTALLGPGGEGWPLLLAVLASVCLAAVAGWLVALGASRLEGPYLALATWGLAWLVQRCLLAYPDVTGGVDGRTTPAPARLVSPSTGVELTLTPGAHVVVAAVLCLVLLVALVRVERGPGGLDLAVLRVSPDLARSLGVPVAARRRAVLAATAALCALSGAGSTVLLGLVSPADVSPLVSLELFVAVLLGGAARWWGPVVGVAVLTAIPELGDALAEAGGLDAERSSAAVTALLLVAVVALRGPVARRLAHGGSPPGTAADLEGPPPAVPGEEQLRASGVTVAYDGLLALDGAGLVVRAGEVHALVGPNGSGKTTLLKALSGAIPQHALAGGVVEVRGRAHRARSESDRVRAGVVRTPQQTLVPGGLRADRQVAAGARGPGASRFAVLRHLLGTPSSRAADPRVQQALEATGLAHLVGADPRRLAVGDQRLLQLARAVATGAPVLLVDEPAAGMTTAERARLAVVLRRLAAAGRAVVLVEHDMRLVGEVADRVTVLDAGRVLATGTPDEVRADPEVRRAYLGAGLPEAAR